MRNLRELAERGKAVMSEADELKASEIYALHEKYIDEECDLFSLICEVWNSGFMVGRNSIEQ